MSPETTDDQPGDENPINQTADGEHAAAISEAAEPAAETNAARSHYRFPLGRVVFFGALALIVGCVAQWFAPQFDHQNANMVCLFVGLLFAIYLLWVTQRAAGAVGKRSVVFLWAAAGLALFVGCFQFNGFSGEMLPQFSWRFSSQRMEIKEVASDDEAGDANSTNTDSISAAKIRNAGSAARTAASDSPQFLGPNRNAVHPDRLFAIPKEAGEAKVLWDQGVGDGWSSFSVVGDRAVTMEQRDENECVTCYRLLDGELLWIDKYEARHEHALGGVGPRSTPTVFDGKVYANGATGFLRCLDLASGELIWSADLKELAGWNQDALDAAAPWGHASSPLVIDTLGICVMSFGGPVNDADKDEDGMTPTKKGLIALDLQSGAEVWRGGRDQFSYASPILMKSINTIVSVNEKTVSGHAPKTGEQLWSFPWPGATNAGANCATAMVVGEDQFVVGKGYGGGSALIKVTQNGDEWTADAEWISSRILKTKFNHTCITGDFGFGLNNGSLQAVRLSTAESLWVQPRRQRSGQGQVVMVGDVLVVQGESGDVVFVSTDESGYRELGRLRPLSSKTWNVPTVAGRHLVVRNDRQAVCYLLPAK